MNREERDALFAAIARAYVRHIMQVSPRLTQGRAYESITNPGTLWKGDRAAQAARLRLILTVSEYMHPFAASRLRQSKESVLKAIARAKEQGLEPLQLHAEEEG